MLAFYFHGDAGCDRCVASTGWYVQTPAEPHPYCVCPIEQFDLEDAEVEVEYRHLLVLDLTAEEVSDETYSNCDGGEQEVPVDIEVPEDEQEDVDKELMEEAESQGWEEPDVERLEASLTVSPHSFVDVTITVHRYTATFLADVWLVCTLDDVDIEVEIAGIEGYYGKNINMDAEITEQGPCATV